MTAKLKISNTLSLPVDLVTESIAIIARKRAGKSYTGRRITEQVFKAGQQVVIVDPKGDWWGIRSSADGKSAGLSIVILGGEHGDIPLEVGSGELVARMVVEQRISVLLDLSSFRKHEVATFMTAFLENLYRLKAQERYRTALLLVVDEADAIAPQRPNDGEQRMLGAIEDVVRRGGQRGIGIVMITQRAAVLNKNVLTQCGIIILLRTTGSQDIDAFGAWIEKHGQPDKAAEVLASIAALPTGTAWIWAPGWPDADGIFEKVEILRIETYDSGATPKVGERREAPKTAADVDLEAFRKEMATTIEKQKATDPKHLQKRIRELEDELKKKPAASAPAKPERVEVPILKDSQVKDLDRIVENCRGMLDKAGAAMQSIYTQLQVLALTESRPAAARGVQPAGRPAGSAAVVPPSARSIPAPSAAAEPSTNGQLTRPQLRILQAMKRLEGFGWTNLKRTWVAPVAETTHKSSSYEKNVSGLKTKGLIGYGGPGEINLTVEGRRDAGDTMQLGSFNIVAMCQAVIVTPQARLLEALAAAYPNDLSREELAEKCSTTTASSSFEKNVSGLKTADMAIYSGKGRVRCAAWIFGHRE